MPAHIGGIEMNFDEKVDRYKTNSLKYDFKADKNKPDDVFPMWVADMDFRCPNEVIEDMTNKIKHGVFGYSQTDESYFNAIYNWYLRHHDVKLNQEWLVKTPGVVFALAMAVRMLTKENDYVLINNPVYYPFTEVVVDNGRQIISSDLINNNGHYEIDFSDFEEKIKKYNIHLFLLCSPHNPVGRVWKKEELDEVIRICKKYDVVIISDEIHCDFIWEGKHNSLLNYEEYLDKIIVCTAPSKTFNLAGLQVSNIFISNKQMKDDFQNEIWKTGYSLLNIMGIVACESAYKNGEEWFDKLKEYLKYNIEYTEKYIEENIPKIKVIHPEGTYLLWLDFNEFNMTDEEIEKTMLDKAKLWLDNGTMFGESGKGFQRLNVALPRKELEFALQQLKENFS